MPTENEQISFFKMLQQFRRIRWGSELQVMTQAEYVAVSAIVHVHNEHPEMPGVYVSVLAEELTVSVSMVSKMLKVLEEKGWILRTVDPHSRRNTFVSLTEEGWRVFQEEQERADATNRLVLERMGEETVTRFFQDAQRLADCYAEVLGTN